MPNISPRVQEFRSIPEEVVRQQVATNIGENASFKRRWIGMEREAVAFGMRFVVLDPTAARSTQFIQTTEKLWGVGLDSPISMLGRAARFAVQSVADKPQSLIRRVSFEGAIPLTAVTSDRELPEQDLDLALNWARSPHLHPNILSYLCELTADETNAVEAAFERNAVDLADLAREQVRITDMTRVLPNGLITKPR